MKKVTMKQVRKRYRTTDDTKSLREKIRETPRSFFVGELSPKLDHIHNGPKR